MRYSRGVRSRRIDLFEKMRAQFQHERALRNGGSEGVAHVRPEFRHTSAVRLLNHRMKSWDANGPVRISRANPVHPGARVSRTSVVSDRLAKQVVLIVHEDP